MLQRAMIHEAGHLLVWRAADDEHAVLYGRRRDTGSELEATFTIEHALPPAEVAAEHPSCPAPGGASALIHDAR